MLDVVETLERAKRFNSLEIGDRIVYSHRNKLDKKTIKTRRIIAKNPKTVTVMEMGKKTLIRWDKIIMA